jgi:ferritin-like metal-binding protein YciE
MGNPDLQNLFVEQIRDLYDAEKQLVKALPKLAKAAESEDLAEAIRTHLEETQGHVTRLEEVFQQAGVSAKGKPCKGMRGLIEEGSEAIQKEEEGAKRDLAIIAGAQKVEHYEMSAYGTCRTLADRLGMTEAAELLQQTEDEEEAADSKLTEIADTLYDAVDQKGEEEGEEDLVLVGASSNSRRQSSPSSKKPSSKKPSNGNRRGR